MESRFDRKALRWAASFLATSFVVVVGCGGADTGPSGDDPKGEMAEVDDFDEVGDDDSEALLRRNASSFLSADWPVYSFRFEGEEEEEEEEEEEDERELEEGDIYRVLGDGYLLNLNAYRGLQVIRIADPSNPTIVGQLAVSGAPVEMYVVGDRAIALMNDWFDYSGRAGDVNVQARRGGTVLLIDFSNRAAPRLLSQYAVLGNIRTSRLARGAGGEALYVASTHSGFFRTPSGGLEFRQESVVTSFGVTESGLVERSRLSLGGDVSAIHAEQDALLVAREPSVGNESTITLVDISSIDGTMVLRDSFVVPHSVISQFHMDLRGTQIRVFSGPRFGASSSWLTTWDASNPDDIRPLDREEFGTGQSIFGAVFLDDRAFAVTFLRVDPFHAFSIGPEGQIVEESEFVVSGWNDFLRPVLGGTRLVGIGVDNPGGRNQLAASLYDITDLRNPNPLIARDVVTGTEGGWNWSEASWDHRAFTVADDAVEVRAPTGEIERGLVLLPFNSQRFVDGRYRLTSAVQIFTYSSTTLTRRGVMVHGSPVRRAFRLGGSNAANLSDTALSIHDTSDLDRPVERSILDLAPDFLAVFAFGDHRVRVRNPSQYWEDFENPTTMAEVEVVPRGVRVDTAQPIARARVPLNAQLVQAGDKLVAITNRFEGWPTIETTLDVIDLADPTRPRSTRLVTTDLPPAGGVFWDDRFLPTVYATRTGLAFLRALEHSEVTQRIRACSTFVSVLPECAFGADRDGCTYWAGNRTCRTVEGQAEYCDGGFALCTDHAGDDTTCVRAEDTGQAPQVGTYCSNLSGQRRHLQFEIDPVDLRGATPVLGTPVRLPEADEGVSVLAADDDVWVTVKRPTDVADDPRPHARYYVRRIDLGDPSRPALGRRVNVPGELVDVRGSRLFTRDRVWGPQYLEGAIARLTLRDDTAYLRSYRTFPDRRVEGVVVDAHRNPIVLHDLVWRGSDDVTRNERLSIFSIDPPSGGDQTAFSLLSSSRITMPFVELRFVQEHRLFTSISGGTLMIDVRDPARPQAQSFFFDAREPIVIDAGEVLAAAGRREIHQQPIGASNLFDVIGPEGDVASEGAPLRARNLARKRLPAFAFGRLLAPEQKAVLPKPAKKPEPAKR